MKGCCRLAGLAKRKQDNPSPATRELPLHKGAFLCLHFDSTIKSRRVLYPAAYFIYSENQWSIQAPQPHTHVRISRAMMMSHTTSLPKRSQRQFIVVFLSSFIISDRNPLWSVFCSHSNIIVCSGGPLCA